MEAPGYPHYVGQKLWTVMPAAFVVKQHVETFKAFPPRQAPGDFNTEEMTKNILKLAADANL
jgi:arylsulfatase